MRVFKTRFFSKFQGKNEIENIDTSDLQRFRTLAKEMLAYGDQRIEDALAAGEIEEIFQ